MSYHRVLLDYERASGDRGPLFPKVIMLLHDLFWRFTLPYWGHPLQYRIIKRYFNLDISHFICSILDTSTDYNRIVSSATTLVSFRKTRVFRTALRALMEPRTLRRRNTRFPSPRQQVAFHTYLLYFAPGIWWCIRTIWTTCVLHSLQGLQLCCSHFHNAWQYLCPSLAESNIVPLCYCYISDAALSSYMFSFEMLWLITIQTLLWTHHLPLHLLRHYHILQVWNIPSNLLTQ